jgi:AcrR family transcriptional regulator
MRLMGVKERREREKQELRDKIMEAARAIFAAEGYDAVSMRRIAEQIEYSPAAIYVYFPDKQSLFREICRGDFMALLEQFQTTAAVADPVERLWLIGQGYIDFGVGHPSHYRMMFMRQAPAIPPETEDLQRMGDPNQDGYAFVRATVEELIAARTNA